MSLSSLRDDTVSPRHVASGRNAAGRALADRAELRQALLVLDLAARLLDDAEAVSRECARLIALHGRLLAQPEQSRLDPAAVALLHAGAVRIRTALDGDQVT